MLKACRSKHITKIDEEDTEPIEVPEATCNFCGTGKQDTEHIMSHCDKFATLHLSVFGEAYPHPPYSIPLSKVFDFLKQAKIKSLEMYGSFNDFLAATCPEPVSDSEQEDDPS